MALPQEQVPKLLIWDQQPASGLKLAEMVMVGCGQSVNGR